MRHGNPLFLSINPKCILSLQRLPINSDRTPNSIDKKKEIGTLTRMKDIEVRYYFFNLESRKVSLDDDAISGDGKEIVKSLKSRWKKSGRRCFDWRHQIATMADCLLTNERPATGQRSTHETYGPL